MEFKLLLFEDQKKRLEDKKIDCEILDISEIKNLNNTYLFYPSIGENLDYINVNNFKNFKFLYRKLDQFSWQYCNKGFFNFKNYIPKYRFLSKIFKIKIFFIFFHYAYEFIAYFLFLKNRKQLK